MLYRFTSCVFVVLGLWFGWMPVGFLLRLIVVQVARVGL